MMNKENNIEHLFKDAFDGFSPDVSPKVWNAVSQQIAHPVAAATQVAGTVAKTVASKLSAWIIGGIALSAITAAVLIYGHKEMVVASSSSGQVSETPSTVLESTGAAGAAGAATAVGIGSGQLAAKQINTSSEKKHLSTTAIADKIISNPSSATPITTNEAAADKQELVNPAAVAQNTVSKNENPTPEKQAVAAPVTTTKEDAEKVSPMILINTTIGFAPLQIACLLNKEELAGDWDFGDGTSQLRTANATHKYTRSGTYIMHCVAGENTLTKTIEVIGTINTAFSPNGDGINDFFFVDANALNSLSLKIFDRNGKKMAELTTLNDKWDGTLQNGEPAAAGTCFYELTATTDTGKEIKQRGTVSLFR